MKMNNLHSETLVFRNLAVELWRLGDSRWCDFPWRSVNYFGDIEGASTEALTPVINARWARTSEIVLAGPALQSGYPVSTTMQ